MKLVGSFLIAGLLGFTSARAEVRLEQLRKLYRASLDAEGGNRQQATLADLESKYINAVDAAVIAASKAGKLDEALALRAEKQRLADKKPIPGNDDDAGPALKPLRTKYRESQAKLEASRGLATIPITKRYEDSLKELEIELTKEGNLDAALEVRKEREELKTGATPEAVPTPAGGGQPQEVSTAGLQGRAFVFGVVKDSALVAFQVFTFGNDGKLLGSYSPNEAKWKVDANGRLLFMANDDKITTIFKTVVWKNGRATITGDYQGPGGVTHQIQELVPVHLKPGLLTSERLSQSDFEFQTSKPFKNDPQKISFIKTGGVNGANFGKSPRWNNTAAGALVVSADDGEFAVTFDKVFTFEEGKKLCLEGSSKTSPPASFRLLEKRF